MGIERLRPQLSAAHVSPSANVSRLAWSLGDFAPAGDPSGDVAYIDTNP
jgi:hypothetical protein